MDLTAEQRAVVAHDGRRVVVRGNAGTGKTATLVERYHHLTVRHPASRVLVVCRNRPLAQLFTAAVLPRLRGGFDALPITTVYGLAHDVLVRGGRSVRLVGAAEQRTLVRRLLATEEPSRWPTSGHLLHRAAFVEEVAHGLRVLRDVGIEAAETAGGRWGELAAFARRYVALLDELGRIDGPGMLTAAVELAPRAQGRFDHALIDDAHAATPLAVELLMAMDGDGLGTTVALDGSLGDASPGLVDGADLDVTLSRSFRVTAPGRLVRCGHPSVEAEAVAGELLAANRGGVPWSAMAVVVRRLDRRARSIGRALARHGIPVVPVPALAPEEPAVRAVVDILRWVDGDDRALERLITSPLARLDSVTARGLRQAALTGHEPLDADPRLAHLVGLRDRLRERLAAGDTPAELAYEVWAAGLADLGDAGLGSVDDRALDALVSLVDGLAQHAVRYPTASLGDTLAALGSDGLEPDPWRPACMARTPWPAASTGTEGVTITSIAAAAGREWHTVVVAGCVEGELPRVQASAPLFDPAVLGGATLDAADRLRTYMAEERRLFGVATTRATGALMASAAPEPGLLLSRFVEAWPEESAVLPLAPGQPPPERPPTAGSSPVSPEGALRLSASQLDTYDDCPLRYAFQYVLRARDEPGVHASLGSFVHDVLASFLEPDSTAPRTLEGLLRLADERWHDDIARYRPQVEEARRDAVAMLTAWWEAEGQQAPEVLAVERPFDIQVGPHRLVGYIDRIDRADDGIGVRVVDYKTGKSEPRPGDVADDLQLAVYHLAATRDPELAALGPPTQLQLRYLRTMHTYAQPITEGHAERTEARVLAIADRILAEDFTPAVDATCRTCSFHRLCPLQPPGRQVGQSS